MGSIEKLFAKNSLILAPMAGFTNPECRRIFRDMGADGVFSEFVYSRAVLKGGARVLEKLAFSESQRPFGAQIFGSDPVEVADAASLIEEKLSPDFIDVNFGCPAPNATSAGAGSALLKEPKKMAEIISAVAQKLKKIPVSAKMRTGWSSTQIILPDAALMLEDAGASMITVHGRTKSQGYAGNADWNIIEQTAKSLKKIPLIGNGSVEKLSSEFLRNSACYGFMIGRAALGNPWIFSEVRAKISGTPYIAPSPSERIALALRYAEAVSSGGHAKISPADISKCKAQIVRFLKGEEGFKKLRVSIMKIKTLEELRQCLSL